MRILALLLLLGACSSPALPTSDEWWSWRPNDVYDHYLNMLRWDEGTPDYNNYPNGRIINNQEP